MIGTLDLVLLLTFAISALFVRRFYRQLKYRNDPRLPLLLLLVLLVILATKILTHIDYLRSLRLYFSVVYLDLAAGFAVGPTAWLVARNGHRGRRDLLHFLPCLLPLCLFALYIAHPAPNAPAQVLRIMNGGDRPYTALEAALFAQFAAYFAAALRASGIRGAGLAAALSAYALAALLSSLGSVLWHGLTIYAMIPTAGVMFALLGLSFSTSMAPNHDACDGQMDPDKREQVAQSLLAYFDAQRPYLERHLTLTDLAARIGCGRSELSAIINASFHKNFTHFVNGYRVEEAKRRLADPSFDRTKIEYLGYECGFASKGAFYAAFRAFTGHTPRHYRQRENGWNGLPPGGTAAVALAVAALAFSAAPFLSTCSQAGAKGKDLWLSGTYASQTPFHGMVPYLVFKPEGAIRFSFVSNNGAYCYSSVGSYVQDGDRIDFEGRGLGYDGSPENDPKDVIDFAFRGRIEYDPSENRWIGSVWADMPKWKLTDTAALSLREGLDISIVLLRGLRLKAYLVWGIWILIFVASRRASALSRLKVSS